MSQCLCVCVCVWRKEEALEAPKTQSVQFYGNLAKSFSLEKHEMETEKEGRATYVKKAANFI